MTIASGDVYVSSILTNLSLAQNQDLEGFVADKVFPVVPVSKQAGKYYVYDNADWNRDEMKKRAPATESKGSSYSLSQDNYYADVWAFHNDIDDQIRANADAAIDLDENATAFLTLKDKLRREVDWAATYFQTGVWATDITGQAGVTDSTHFQYWNLAASTPISDIRTARRTILQTTGQRPNTLVLGAQVADTLYDNPAIVDRIKYNNNGETPAMVDASDLAKLFKIPRVLIMEGIQNTAGEGAAVNNSFIGGKSALLTYSALAPGLLTPSAGYTFAWTGYTGANSNGARIKKFRMEPINSDRVEIESAWDQKVTAASLGLFMSNVIQ